MPKLFPGWADTALRIALVGWVALVLLAVIAPMLWVRTPYFRNMGFPVDQPVQFDHRHHVEDDGVDCRYCHDLVEKGPYAGVPSTEVCMGCHSQIWRQSPMLEPVRRAWFSGRPLAWNRVTKVPDYAYFDHSIHVSHGVGCASCHGRVDRMALAWQVAPLTMGWCLDCHRDPAPNLRPLDKITSMSWQPPAGDRNAYGRKLAQELGVRKLTDCTACHR
jgi:hypothetical protein